VTKPDRDLDNMGRRALLRLGVGGLCTLAAAPAVAAPPRIVPAGDRSLSFRHLHTGEALRATYWADGKYLPGALDDLDRLLRDFRTGETIRMDVGLLDLLHRLHDRMESSEPFHIISAYRSPRTNTQLIRQGRGVATRSLHMVGKAIDVRLPGRRLRDLRQAALELRRGGVGYYPRSNFVHVDTGRVRFW
jgi:uncharacterized protein YcbK (DUF882 family)